LTTTWSHRSAPFDQSAQYCGFSRETASFSAKF
jgi:hypothetical protein